jgi:hypothetical protein
MLEMTLKEIMRMVKNACSANFGDRAGNDVKTIIECATQIYIAQIKGEVNG